MKVNFSKIMLLIFAIALGALVFWGYKVFRRQYDGNAPIVSKQTDQSQNSTVDKQNNTPGDTSAPSAPPEENSNPTAPVSNPDNTSTVPAPPININDRNIGTGRVFAHITTEHCNSDCKAFANDFQLLEYCQQVCGIIPIKNVSDCDGKKGMERDYCLKDLAITKIDPSICEQIHDVNIRQTCQNRIAQDIIENQK
jgi:hypothetical protein